MPKPVKKMDADRIEYFMLKKELTTTHRKLRKNVIRRRQKKIDTLTHRNVVDKEKDKKLEQAIKQIDELLKTQEQNETVENQ